MNKPISELYGEMVAERQPFLDRARDVARLTLPKLLPEEGFSSEDETEPPFAAVGARGVNSLANSMLLSAFPPNAPFFRLMPNAETIAVIESAPPEAKSELEESLAGYERTIVSEIERRGYRGAQGIVMRHLQVTGNILARMLDDKPMRLYRIDTFTRRNYPSGHSPSDIVIKEMVTETGLPPEVTQLHQPEDASRRLWEMYSHVKYPEDESGEVTMRQEVAGIIINETSWDYADCPYLPLGWSWEPGEHYARSFCEDYLGELETLDSLLESVVHGASAAAEVRCLVDPAGTTDLDVMNAPNLSVRSGKADDVSYVHLQKQADFRTAYGLIKDSRELLAQVFLMPEASIRNKDRVTATEIRMVQEQTERATGGNTSIARDFQRPMLRLVIRQLTRKKAFPPIDGKVIDPVIVTGADALARSIDSLKLDALVADLQQTFGPEAAARYVKVDSWLRLKAASLGLDRAELVRTEEEITQAEQAAQQRQVQQRALEAGADSAGAAAGEQLVNPEPQPQEA